MAGISKAERERKGTAKANREMAWAEENGRLIERVAELEEQVRALKAGIDFNANTHAETHARLVEVHREFQTAAAQRDWLIGYANRLIDRFIGVQLLHGLMTIDAAVVFTNAEKAAAEAELQAIKARHAPEPATDDAIMPELRERFTDAKQGIGEDSYLDISATAAATATAVGM